MFQRLLEPLAPSRWTRRDGCAAPRRHRSRRSAGRCRRVGGTLLPVDLDAALVTFATDPSRSVALLIRDVPIGRLPPTPSTPTAPTERISRPNWRCHHRPPTRRTRRLRPRTRRRGSCRTSCRRRPTPTADLDLLALQPHVPHRDGVSPASTPLSPAAVPARRPDAAHDPRLDPRPARPPPADDVDLHVRATFPDRSRRQLPRGPRATTWACRPLITGTRASRHSSSTPTSPSASTTKSMGRVGRADGDRGDPVGCRARTGRPARDRQSRGGPRTSPFAARFDGTDRWLQRTFVVDDLAPSAADRRGRVIVTEFGRGLPRGRVMSGARGPVGGIDSPVRSVEAVYAAIGVGDHGSGPFTDVLIEHVNRPRLTLVARRHTVGGQWPRRVSGRGSSARRRRCSTESIPRLWVLPLSSTTGPGRPPGPCSTRRNPARLRLGAATALHRVWPSVTVSCRERLPHRWHRRPLVTSCVSGEPAPIEVRRRFRSIPAYHGTADALRRAPPPFAIGGTLLLRRVRVGAITDLADHLTGAPSCCLRRRRFAGEDGHRRHLVW